MSKHTYSIVKKNKNINLATFVKTGIESKQTILELANDVRDWTKTKREMFANRGIFQAMIINIERNYPFVKKLTAEELQAITVYAQKKIQLEQANTNLSLLNKNYKSYSAEFKDIKDALDITEDTELDMAFAEFQQVKDTASEMIKKATKNDKN